MIFMKRIGLAALMAAALLLMAPQAFAQSTGQGRAVVTVLGKHRQGRHSDGMGAVQGSK
jgi:uncharacterized protein YggE